jgi:O-antigen ligase/Flp pilus assembly protein TadD
MLSALDKIYHWGLVVISLLAPLIFLRGIYDFANLPQSAFIQIGVLFLLLVWLVKSSIRKKCLILKSPLNLPILAFVLWSLASTFYAHNKYEGFLAWRSWAASALMFFLVANDTYEKRRLIHLLAAIFVSATLSSLLGIAQYLLDFSWVPQTRPPGATFANRNMAAHFIVLSFPLALGFIVNSKRRILALISAVAACLMIVFVLYTRTRAAWVALGVEILFLVILLLRERIQSTDAPYWGRSKSLTVGLAVVVLFVMMNLGPKGFTWRVGELWRHIAVVTEYEAASSAAHDDGQRSIPLRRAIWLNTIEMIKDRPWIGLGLGNHKVFYPLYHRTAIKDRAFSIESQLMQVHNDFLQAFAELGVVGMLLLGWIGFVWVSITTRLTSPRYSSDVRFWTLGITLGIVGLLVNALFSFPFQRAIPPFSFMMLLGVLGSFYAGDDRKFYSIGPRWIVLCACVVVLVGLIWMVRFQYQGIVCDRHLLRVAQLERSKNWYSLIAEAQKAYRSNPARIKTLSYAGRAYIETGDYQKGIETLQRVVAAYPNHMNALLNLGIAYDRVGDNENALKAYEKALLINPDDSKVRRNVASIYIRQQKLDKALAELNIAAELDPEDAAIHYNIGAVKMRNGQYQEAAVAFERAVQLSPQWAPGHKNLGVIYVKFLDRKEEGLDHLKKALELNPGMKDADRIREMIRLTETLNG